MNKNMSNGLIMALVVLLLGGCVHQKITPTINDPEKPRAVQSAIQTVGKKIDLSIKGRDFLLEPTESLGLEITPAFKEGAISVYWGVFNPILLGEGALNRVRWVGLAETEDGREFFVQILRWPVNQLAVDGSLTVKIIVEDGGDYVPVKVLYFSSALHWAYDAFGEESPVTSVKKLMGEQDFRRQFILSKGTSTRELQQITTVEFWETLKGWTQYSTPDGTEIYSPLSKEQVKKIAGRNSEYSAFQKWVAHGRKPIYPLNPIMTGVANAMEIAEATLGNAPPHGWSLNSILTRREAAESLKTLSEQYRELVRFWMEKANKCQ